MANKTFQMACLLIVLNIITISVAYAFVYQTQTNNVTQAILRNWLSDWNKRIRITIDHNNIDSDLSNFPVSVHLSSSSGIYSDNLSFIFEEIGSNSKKIAMTTSNSTQCYVEVEKWIYPLSPTTEILRPNHAGDATQISSVYPFGTPHWQAVDEETANGDTDYVYTSSSSYQRDLYDLPNHTGSGTINSVTVYFCFRTSSSSNTAYARASIKTHGTVYTGSDQSDSSTSYVTRSYTWTTNPYTGSSWTWGEIDDLQAGLDLRRSTLGYYSRCTQVYAEINFTPQGGEAWLWTKVPSISSTTDTRLYLYYDNNHVDNTDYVGDTGSAPAMSVWDDNFQEVCHLEGDPTQQTSTNWGKTDIGTTSTNGASISRAMGGTSPNLDDMKIKSISVYLGAQTGNVRLAVYSGGQLDDPSSATLLWDAGTINPNGVAGWYTINHPAGGVSWPKSTVTWLAWKLNTSVSVYADSASSEAGDFQTQRGRNDNNFDQNPSVAFPSTYGQQGTFSNYWYSIYLNYENVAGPLQDSTSNQNNPTSDGSMTLANQVTGKIDGSVSFDGDNDELLLGNPSSLQITGSLTVSAWVKPAVTVSYMGIGGKLRSSGTYAGYALSKSDSNYFRFQVGSGTSGSTLINSNSVYADTDWHNIVGVRSGSTMYLYVDGVQQIATATATLLDSGQTAFIGRQYNDYDSRWWNGVIDEFRISNMARNAAWIKASYESGRDQFIDFGPQELQ